MKPANTVMASVLFIIAGSCLSSLASAQVTLHFNERPPSVFFKEGRLLGLVGSPIEAAFRAADIQYTLALTPIARQLLIIKSNTGLDCLASGAFKNEEREAQGKFTEPIYRDKARIALTSARNTKVKDDGTIESVLGDKTIRLLVKQGYSYGKVIDDLIKKLQPKKTTVAVENISMVKMILADRADLMFISLEEAEGVIDASGIDAGDVRKIHFSNAPRGEYRYIFCSKRVPDEIINKLNAVIEPPE